MSNTQQKLVIKGPEPKPFKAAEPTPTPTEVSDWQPIDTAPQEAEARFMVRAMAFDKDQKTRIPVSGTETIVRYRASRKMVGRRWQTALAMIDDRLGTKLGFRPNEWKPVSANA